MGIAIQGQIRQVANCLEGALRSQSSRADVATKNLSHFEIQEVRRTESFAG